MANIPGAPTSLQAGVYSRVRTIRRAVSVPGGLRVLAVIGEGQAQETIVLNALGDGLDGMNADYSGSDKPDGRHFMISAAPVVQKRTALLLNGIPLNGLESSTITPMFSSKYDYMFDYTTGRIAMQQAYLVSQGADTYVASSANTGTGTISTLVLTDTSAPEETWTIRCSGVVRDAFGDPIGGLATFSSVGSVSGQQLDAYGNPIIIRSDGYAVNNNILTIAITEGATYFDIGDRFTVQVASRVLKKGDLLESTYIPEINLNAPQFITDASALFQEFGSPSVANSLSLGAQLAFENGAFGIMCVQAAPPVPRRLSEVVLAVNDPLSSDDGGFPDINHPPVADDAAAFEYTLLSGKPAADSAVHIFVTDFASGKETQVFPNKVAFYSSAFTSDPWTSFIDSPNYTYSYTVISVTDTEQEGLDGYVNGMIFTAPSALFTKNSDPTNPTEDDVGNKIVILPFDADGNPVDPSIAGSYTISDVGGFHTVTLSTTPLAATDKLRWQLINTATSVESAQVLFTKDLATSGTFKRGDGIRVTYVDIPDELFFDTNWEAALAALEKVDCQMVCPLPSAAISNIQQATIAHCELMSNTVNQSERVALIGAIKGITVQALLGLTDVAVEDIGILEGIQGSNPEDVLNGNIEDLANYDTLTNFGYTFRAVYFWPDEIIVPINGANTDIDGFYIAAAAGGWFAATANLAMPLTRKVLTGFSISNTKLTSAALLNELAGNGVTALQPVVGGGQVLLCQTTTDSGDPLELEPSVVFIRDRVAQSLRAALRGFIGQPQDPTMVASIIAVVTKVLQSLVTQGLLAGYRNINVSRDDTDPRQYNVNVEVAPTLPIDWIFVDVGVSIF